MIRPANKRRIGDGAQEVCDRPDPPCPRDESRQANRVIPHADREHCRLSSSGVAKQRRASRSSRRHMPFFRADAHEFASCPVCSRVELSHPYVPSPVDETGTYGSNFRLSTLGRNIFQPEMPGLEWLWAAAESVARRKQGLCRSAGGGEDPRLGRL